MGSILVTGGAGFMGSHVAEELIKRGHRVTILDDLSGGFVDNVPPQAQLVIGSITDRDLVEQLFDSQRFDHVYHLAAYAAEGLSHFIRHFNYMNNLIGSVNLINASVNTGVKCFVFTSSIAVYGSSPDLPMREETPAHPEDPYGIAKLAVEQDLASCHQMFGLNYVIFRPHNVYGERQNIGDRYRNVVGIFMNQILQDQPMTIFGDGQQTRAFTYIRDIAPIMADAIEIPEAWNEVFNLGADQPYTVRELPSAWRKPWVSNRRFVFCRLETKCSTPTQRMIKCGGCLASDQCTAWTKVWPRWPLGCASTARDEARNSGRLRLREISRPSGWSRFLENVSSD